MGGADGQPFIVKNLFELKVGTRVLFESNVLEGSWGGFTQVGFAIVLTPRNQADKPSTQITDITIRNCVIRHVGSGMQIANPAGDVSSSVAGERYSIHDMVFDDIDDRRFEGHGNLAQIGMGHSSDTPVLRHVRIDHVTAFPRHVLLALGGPYPPQISDIVFTNNLVSAGQYGINPAGAPCNLPGRRDPSTLIENCWKSYEFKNNLILEDHGGWPKGNVMGGSLESAGVKRVEGSSGPLPALSKESPFKGKTSDGKDFGADVEAVERAIAGVD